jgi:hypothetical protein
VSYSCKIMSEARIGQPEVGVRAVTVEELRSAHKAAPFRPFTIRMADGLEFRIPHPEFLSILPSGSTAVIYHPDDSASIVDLLLMTELELSRISTAGA